MTRLVDSIARWFGRRLTRYLSKVTAGSGIVAPVDPALLMACLRPGDVLLVEGRTRVSTAIKYLTQSTWSHAALFVGNATGLVDPSGQPRCFVEADIRYGVRAVALSEFDGLNSRVCRPVGLEAEEMAAVIRFAVERVGLQYDVKNVVDLARYLLPTPPVPVRWRRRMIALGSGDPTRAICSTLIAQAFQSVQYPILPRVETVPSNDPDCNDCVSEILHVRHHSLFVPRDFDVSPYFEVIKPTLEAGFDHRQLRWGSTQESAPASNDGLVSSGA
jgi:Permuted papain-like amidase enzyme, YaeF/YiiX, C92 family